MLITLSLHKVGLVWHKWSGSNVGISICMYLHVEYVPKYKYKEKSNLQQKKYIMLQIQKLTFIRFFLVILFAEDEIPCNKSDLS